MIGIRTFTEWQSQPLPQNGFTADNRSRNGSKWRQLHQAMGFLQLELCANPELWPLLNHSQLFGLQTSLQQNGQDTPALLANLTPHRNEAWVLLAFLNQPETDDSPFRKDGVMIPCQWRHTSELASPAHDPRLPLALRQLAGSIRRQFKNSQGFQDNPLLRQKDPEQYWLRLTNEGLTDDRQLEVFANDADHDASPAQDVISAWGALATGLYYALTDQLPAAEWPFSSISYDETDQTVSGVGYLEQKLSVAIDFHATRFAVAPEQKRPGGEAETARDNLLRNLHEREKQLRELAENHADDSEQHDFFAKRANIVQQRAKILQSLQFVSPTHTADPFLAAMEIALGHTDEWLLKRRLKTAVRLAVACFIMLMGFLGWYQFGYQVDYYQSIADHGHGPAGVTPLTTPWLTTLDATLRVSARQILNLELPWTAPRPTADECFEFVSKGRNGFLNPHVLATVTQLTNHTRRTVFADGQYISREAFFRTCRPRDNHQPAGSDETAPPAAPPAAPVYHFIYKGHGPDGNEIVSQVTQIDAFGKTIIFQNGKYLPRQMLYASCTAPDNIPEGTSRLTPEETATHPRHFRFTCEGLLESGTPLVKHVTLIDEDGEHDIYDNGQFLPWQVAYADYVAKYGIPEGLSRLTPRQTARRSQYYRFTYCGYHRDGRNRLQAMEYVDASTLPGRQDTRQPVQKYPLDYARITFTYDDNGKIKTIHRYDDDDKLLNTLTYDDNDPHVIHITRPPLADFIDYRPAPRHRKKPDQNSSCSMAQAQKIVVTRDDEGRVKNTRYSMADGTIVVGDCHESGWNLEYAGNHLREARMVDWSGGQDMLSQQIGWTNVYEQNLLKSQKRMLKDTLGNYTHTYVYVYDDAGNCLQWTMTSDRVLDKHPRLDFSARNTIHYENGRPETITRQGSSFVLKRIHATGSWHRKTLHYDSQGNVRSEHLYDEQDKLYAQINYDDYGRFGNKWLPATITCKDQNGQPLANHDGLLSLSRKYQNGRLVVRSRYGRTPQDYYEEFLASQGRFAQRQCIGRQENVYDEHGRMISRTIETGKDIAQHVDSQVTTTMDYSHYPEVWRKTQTSADHRTLLEKMVFNTENQLVSCSFHDGDGKPAVNEYGAHEMTFEWQGDNVKSVAFFGRPEGIRKPRIMAHDYFLKGTSFHKWAAKTDGSGVILEERFTDTDGRLSLQAPLGYARYFSQYDKAGRLLEYQTRNEDDRPCLPVGYDHVGKKIEWFPDSMSEKTITYINLNGLSNKKVWDTQNRLREWLCLDDEGHPIDGSDGIARESHEYEDNPDKIKSYFFNEHGMQTLNKDLIANWNNLHLEKLRSFNQDDALKLNNDHIAGWDRLYDENNKLLFEQYIGTNGKRTYCNNKVAAIIYAYDQNGYETKRRFLDENLQQTANNDGWGGWDSVYDVGQKIKEIHVDRYGKILSQGNTVPVYTYTYDKKYRKYEVRYRDENDKPYLYGGIYGIRFFYDQNNRVMQKRWLNADSQYCLDDDHIGGYQYEYDYNGKEILRYYLDADGNRTTYQGTVAVQSLYNARVQKIGEKLIKKDNTPVIDKPYRPGFSVMECPSELATVFGKEIPYIAIKGILLSNNSQSFSIDEIHLLDNQLQLIDDFDGWAIIKYQHDKRGDLTEIKLYDKNNSPVNSCKFGYHQRKIVTRRSDEQTIITFSHFTDDTFPIESKFVDDSSVPYCAQFCFNAKGFIYQIEYFDKNKKYFSIYIDKTGIGGIRIIRSADDCLQELLFFDNDVQMDKENSENDNIPVIHLKFNPTDDGNWEKRTYESGKLTGTTILTPAQFKTIDKKFRSTLPQFQKDIHSAFGIRF